MVTEQLCQAIIAQMYGRTCTTTKTTFPGQPEESKSSYTYQNAVGKEKLFDALLLSFDIREIEDGISWLKVRGFVQTFGYGLMAPEMGYELTAKGINYGEKKEMPAEDRKRLSAEVLSVQPEFYGVTLNPKELWWRIRRIFKA